MKDFFNQSEIMVCASHKHTIVRSLNSGFSYENKTIMKKLHSSHEEQNNIMTSRNRKIKEKLG